MTREDMQIRVGPVLEVSEAALAIVAAIRARQSDVEVQDCGSYLRVLVPYRCTVTRAAIEYELGRSFHLPGELELVMPSFKGSFRVNDEEATWQLARP